MKKSLFKMLFVSVALMGASSLMAQTEVVSATVGVTARLSKQMVVTKLTDVDFGGIFIPRTTTAVATMSHLGVVTATNTSLYSTNLQQNGMIRVDADANATFAVTYPATLDLNGALGGSLVYTPELYDYLGVAVPSSSSTTYNMVGMDDANDGTINRMFRVAGSVSVPTTAKTDTYIGNLNVTYTWN